MSEIVVDPYPEFVDRDFDRPPFLIKPLFVSGGIHMIYGREGTGKTQLVMTLAHHLLSGTPLFGRFDVTRGSRVCYFGVDMPLQMLKDRLGNFRDTLVEPERFLIAAKDSSIDITQTPTNARWAEKIRAFDPDIIFVDTLRKIHHLDENTSQTVAQVYASLDRVFGGERAIALVHHANKPSGNPDYSRDEEDRARGSIAWLADADLGLFVDDFENPMSQGSVKISFPRIRFSEEMDPITCKLNRDTLLLEPKTDPKAEDLVREFLSRASGPVAKLDIANWLQDKHGYTKQHAYEAMRNVEDADGIEI